MRVLLTTDTVGGVWTFTKELTGGLLARGHAVALVSFGGLPDASQAEWIGWAKDAGEFLYEASAVPLEWMQGNADAMDGRRVLERAADRFAPDLLHSNQFCYGALDGFGARLATAHSDVLSWAAACRPEGLEDSAWLRTYKRLVQEGLDGAHAVAAPTAWMLDALAGNFRLPAVREVILNGRDVPVRRVSRRELQAVTAGRVWDEAKGLQTFGGLELPFPVVVAGDVRGEGNDATVQTGVRYAGRLGEKELLALFDSSAIYLAASTYEPFGLAPLEAALCGCAVVANDLASLREVWKEGALYFAGQAELRSLLMSLREDGTRLAEAQRRSQARARELGAGRMTEAYLRLYGRLLAQHSHGAGTGMAYAH